MTDLDDITPHEDDLIVISIIVMGCNVYWILVDQGISIVVMFWETFVGLNIPQDQLRPFDGTLMGFLGEQGL